MTTSATAFLHEIVNYERIPVGTLAYFEARLQDRIYNLIVSEFLRKEANGEMTRADLAYRIHKDPAQISRYLASPGNWTLETISRLLLGVAAAELDLGFKSLGRSATSTPSISMQSKNSDGSPVNDNGSPLARATQIKAVPSMSISTWH